MISASWRYICTVISLQHYSQWLKYGNDLTVHWQLKECQKSSPGWRRGELDCILHGEKSVVTVQRSLPLQGLCRDYGTHLHKQPFRGELDVIVKLLGLMCGFYPGWASLVAQMVKIDWNPGDPDSFPGSGRSSGEGNSYPLQYSCLENSTNKKAWRTTVHGVTRVRYD